MKRTLVGFVAGILSATVAFFVLYQQERSGSGAGVEAERGSVAIKARDTPQPSVPTPALAPALSALLRSDSRDIDDSAVGQTDQTPKPAGRPRQDLLRVAERSSEFWAGNKDRFKAFANEARDTSVTANTLESSVLNETWRVAGDSYVPSSSEVECRLSACRVRLSYASAEELLAATRSNIDLRMLVGLEPYGFVSADKTPEGDPRALDPQPDASGQILDIYLWREAQSGR